MISNVRLSVPPPKYDPTLVVVDLPGKMERLKKIFGASAMNSYMWGSCQTGVLAHFHQNNTDGYGGRLMWIRDSRHAVVAPSRRLTMTHVVSPFISPQGA